MRCVQLVDGDAKEVEITEEGLKKVDHGYGYYGVLLSNESTHVQCHICGRWYRFLATHVWKTHGSSANEYRQEYQLGILPLCSPDFSDLHREITNNLISSGVIKISPNVNSDEFKSARAKSQKGRTRSEYAKIILKQLNTDKEIIGKRKSKLKATWDTRLSQKTHCLNGHLYTDGSFRIYKGKRVCKICKHELYKKSSSDDETKK